MDAFAIRQPRIGPANRQINAPRLLPTRNVNVLATSAAFGRASAQETPERHSRQSAPYSLG